jgi:hypothetical protein
LRYCCAYPPGCTGYQCAFVREGGCLVDSHGFVFCSRYSKMPRQRMVFAGRATYIVDIVGNLQH